MSGMTEEIEDARAKVAFYRLRAERPGSRLEDDFALERARVRLLTLELRHLKQGGETKSRSAPAGFPKRTKREQLPGTARDRAETAFASLQAGAHGPESPGETLKGEKPRAGQTLAVRVRGAAERGKSDGTARAGENQGQRLQKGNR